ncbi:hypothetical protein GALMADRAFT_148020 [Galerina marginata CBS 339.88]|uniref:Uncharacterized protein n=1 Tax=Galerina marginata (strain CBS 339.88) TaxID=685588 RepID=A0A067SET1_GALM3|nr:hypothetical protein GALMADRAFT_148020 [Galerina marginata CBS 339.88]
MSSQLTSYAHQYETATIVAFIKAVERMGLAPFLISEVKGVKLNRIKQVVADKMTSERTTRFEYDLNNAHQLFLSYWAHVRQVQTNANPQNMEPVVAVGNSFGDILVPVGEAVSDAQPVASAQLVAQPVASAQPVAQPVASTSSANIPVQIGEVDSDNDSGSDYNPHEGYGGYGFEYCNCESKYGLNDDHEVQHWIDDCQVQDTRPEYLRDDFY